MDMKDPFGVSSSYTLLEASGDSEADCNNPTLTMDEHGYEIGRSDDDAQSCSFDNSETCNAAELDGCESWDKADDDGDDAEDEKKDDGHGTSYCDDDDDDDEMPQKQMSCESDDSGQELEDEMEKNRQFWEACLAS